MILKKWEELPPEMKTDAVRPYYELLRKRRGALLAKRCFDVSLSAVLLLLLLPLFVILSVAIKLDSEGPVFFRQVRVTQYGAEFRIFKFRTMRADAEKRGAQLTVDNDARITRLGRFLRRFRLDETGQLIDILRGKMTFVGTRPETPKYVARYSPEMRATLLLPAGLTSEASIRFRNESALLRNADEADEIYVREILPRKMELNLSAIKNFSLRKEFLTMFRTVFSVAAKDGDIQDS